MSIGIDLPAQRGSPVSGPPSGPTVDDPGVRRAPSCRRVLAPDRNSVLVSPPCRRRRLTPARRVTRPHSRRRSRRPAVPCRCGPRRGPFGRSVAVAAWVWLLVMLGRSVRWVAVCRLRRCRRRVRRRVRLVGLGLVSVLCLLFLVLWRRLPLSVMAGVCVWRRFCGGRRRLWPSSSGLVSPFGVDQVCLGACRAWANRSMRSNHVFDIWLGYPASRAGGSDCRCGLVWVPATGFAAGASGTRPVLVPVAQAGAAPLARWAGYWTPVAHTRAEGLEKRRVRVIQRVLTRLGKRPGPVDGLFGPLTEAGVVRFQRSVGIAADGVVGRQTARRLLAAATRLSDARLARQPGPGKGHGPVRECAFAAGRDGRGQVGRRVWVRRFLRPPLRARRKRSSRR